MKAFPDWQDDHYYRAGSMVEFGDDRYRAVLPSAGLKPGDHPSYWVILKNKPIQENKAGSGISLLGADSEPETLQRQEETDIAPAITLDPIIQEPKEEAQRPKVNDPFMVGPDGPVKDWDAKYFYLQGAQVIFEGKNWIAALDSRMIPPGIGQQWRPNGVYNWIEQVRYEINDIVFYQGSYWRALSMNVSSEPSPVNSNWKSLGANIDFSAGGALAESVAYWSRSVVYDRPGISVYHQGRFWRNSGHAVGGEPGIDPVWEAYGSVEEKTSSDVVVFGVANWSRTKDYSTAGEEITHEGKLWVNSRRTIGEEPGEAAVWLSPSEYEELYGSSDTGSPVVPTEPIAPPPPPPTVVTAPETVIDGAEGATTPLWEPIKTYEAGNEVGYNNKVWRAEWWAQNQVPGTNTVWQRVYETMGPYPWLETQIYKSEGFSVSYQGAIYRNKWWADAGVRPGTNGVWEALP